MLIGQKLSLNAVLVKVMRLKTETRNTQKDASVNDDDKKERTHQTPARTASYPHKYIVLHLAILTSVDGVKWAGL